MSAARRVVAQLPYQLVEVVDQFLLGVFGMRCLTQLDELGLDPALSGEC